MPNRLAQESSPYLRQHADNPVDWYPWGQEALQKARDEEKPIFLSIGYSSCHWCHVMAHESFEDARVAELLNRHFVSVKVDREERPDLDQLYMNALQAMTGQGGWPMSLFLTPEGEPFFGGTYFPPIFSHGLHSFTDVLMGVIDAWDHRRREIRESGRDLVAALQRQSSAALEEEGGEALRADILDTAARKLLKEFDRQLGGWGQGPKFPQPMALEFLLRQHRASGDPELLAAVCQALEAMARGGIYDHLGGGFHRYSVDARWVIPHFEKMLYDNAQLARLYLHGWQVTGNHLFRAVAEEILDYLAREMLDPSGGFYSSQDADTEGSEGNFYLWTVEEIRGSLGEEAEGFLAAYGVTDEGNFEGKSILTLVAPLEARDRFATARERLLDLRGRRAHPGRDDKLLTSWNGLALAAFAEAARVLNRADYRQVAEGNAEFLLREMRTPEGRLMHGWRPGRTATIDFLEDYAYPIEGLLEMYQTSFDPVWYLTARSLAEVMMVHFPAASGFYDTPDDQEPLIVRPREIEDGAVPSGNAMAALGLLHLAGLAVHPGYAELAERSLASMQPWMSEYPLGFSQWLIALDYALAHPREVAIVGELRHEDTGALMEVASRGYRPHQILAVGSPEEAAREIPLLEGRSLIENRATAYVCIDYACRPPITDPTELERLLEEFESPQGTESRG